MKVFKTTSGMLGVNSYFIVNDNNQAIVIDCGEDCKTIENIEMEKGFTVKVALLTHYHFDHSLCCKKLQEKGILIGISKKDAEFLSKGIIYPNLNKKTAEEVTPDFTFTDGESLNLLGVDIKVMETAGHSKGSVCFILNDVIFSGDTLFQLSYGRTDFIDGNQEELRESLKKLFALKGEYVVCPGHGENTSLNFERENNPINYD